MFECAHVTVYRGFLPMFKTKPFMIIRRTDQEGDNEAHRISQ